jgi:hypothetical protein
VEKLIAVLEGPLDMTSKDGLSRLISVLRIVYNLVTLGAAPTEPTAMKEDILSLSSLPSTVLKIVKDMLREASPITHSPLTEALRTFSSILIKAFDSCKPHLLKHFFPIFHDLMNNSPQVQEQATLVSSCFFFTLIRSFTSTLSFSLLSTLKSVWQPPFPK